MALQTMDDLHKPALDGIGYQDSINSERAWWAGYYNADPDKKDTAARYRDWETLRRKCQRALWC